MNPDLDVIVNFLSAIFVGMPGEVELAWSGAGKDAITRARHYATSELEVMAEAAADRAEDGANLYFIPACLRPDVGGRARDADVTAVPSLWTDLDDPEAYHARAGRWGSCPPNLIVQTREDRAHLYWRLRDSVAGDEAKRLNQQITAHMQGDETAVNPARLMRLPGVPRWPTLKKAIGPLYVPAIHRSDHRYTVAEIEKAFPGAERARAPGTPLDQFLAVASNGTDWDNFLAEPIGEGGRNRKLFSLTGKLLSRNLSPYLVSEIMQAVNVYHCDPPLDEGEVDELVNSCCKTVLRRVQADGQ